MIVPVVAGDELALRLTLKPASTVSLTQPPSKTEMFYFSSYGDFQAWSQLSFEEASASHRQPLPSNTPNGDE